MKFIIFALVLFYSCGTVLLLTAEDTRGNKCVDNDDCVKGIPGSQAPIPGTCCDLDHPGVPIHEGYCVPPAKAKRCAPN